MCAAFSGHQIQSYAVKMEVPRQVLFFGAMRCNDRSMSCLLFFFISCFFSLDFHVDSFKTARWKVIFIFILNLIFIYLFIFFINYLSIFGWFRVKYCNFFFTWLLKIILISYITRATSLEGCFILTSFSFCSLFKIDYFYFILQYWVG